MTVARAAVKVLGSTRTLGWSGVFRPWRCHRGTQLAGTHGNSVERRRKAAKSYSWLVERLAPGHWPATGRQGRGGRISSSPPNLRPLTDSSDPFA
jgi:hypothetical protein